MQENPYEDGWDTSDAYGDGGAGCITAALLFGVGAALFLLAAKMAGLL